MKQPGLDRQEARVGLGRRGSLMFSEKLNYEQVIVLFRIVVYAGGNVERAQRLEAALRFRGTRVDTREQRNEKGG
jgi:hypothetical protein